MLSGANLRRSHLGYVIAGDNRRARILGGGGCLLMAAQCAASAVVAPTGLAAVIIGLLGLLCAVIGVRIAYAFSFRISDTELRLLFAFHTRRIPIGQVVDCRPGTGSKGLLSPRIFPEFVLVGGDVVRFTPLQWPTSRPGAAADGCSAIAEGIGRGAEQPPISTGDMGPDNIPQPK